MKFTLYTTLSCAYCKQLKKFLGAKSVNYETVDITNDHQTSYELQKLYGATTVPILVREDGEYMIGMNMPKLMSLL